MPYRIRKTITYKWRDYPPAKILVFTLLASGNDRYKNSDIAIVNSKDVYAADMHTYLPAPGELVPDDWPNEMEYEYTYTRRDARANSTFTHRNR